MICWDTAHPDLWRQYAGQIDMMVIASCPPDVTNPTYHLPNEVPLTLDDFGSMAAQVKDTGRLLFGDMINQQTAWLGVPAVNSTGTGHIQTAIPNGFLSLALFLPAAPWIAKYLFQANQLQLSCNFVQGCKVVDAQGQVLTELEQAQGESFTLAEVVLADQKPSPYSPQPRSLLPQISYFSSDLVLPWLSTPVYRRGLRRVWGAEMAPLAASTRRRLVLASIGVMAVLTLGLALRLYFRYKKV
jgi:hypothetical protein